MSINAIPRPQLDYLCLGALVKYRMMMFIVSPILKLWLALVIEGFFRDQLQPITKLIVMTMMILTMMMKMMVLMMVMMMKAFQRSQMTRSLADPPNVGSALVTGVACRS